uniref:Cilia and flagella associated protein 69 n=1 Tax=Ictidomys tridecemlineatus TaxID=43179 RepID=A0A287D676_ICTTR
LANKSWENFLARTSNAKTLKVPSGGVVTVESTPVRLLGGPLADTDLALKKLPIRGGALQRVKAIKIGNGQNKSIPS